MSALQALRHQNKLFVDDIVTGGKKVVRDVVYRDKLVFVRILLSLH
jgi:hypothetical protein